MRRLFFLICAFAPMLALACYNDRDTLGFELHNKPDVQKALTGRFDRFPSLYYTMRVDRLNKKRNLTPNEYDDLAVALGRLGRDDEALNALARKAKLPSLTDMDRYRLYANRGTIEAHRYMKEGGKLERLSELKHAAADIAEALKLNPHAHFGREGTQLLVIKWLIDLKDPKALSKWEKGDRPDEKSYDEHLPLAYWLDAHDEMQDVDMGTTLAGLVMLGGAWESPDVALAIGVVHSKSGNEATTVFAYERYKELVKMGRHPIDQDLADDQIDLIKHSESGSTGRGVPPTPERYASLRKEAEDWHSAKTAYMMERLNKGLHPDTDPDFWKDWKEPEMPVLPTKIPGHTDWNYVAISVLELISAAAILAAILIFARRMRAKHA